MSKKAKINLRIKEIVNLDSNRFNGKVVSDVIDYLREKSKGLDNPILSIDIDRYSYDEGPNLRTYIIGERDKTEEEIKDKLERVEAVQKEKRKKLLKARSAADKKEFERLLKKFGKEIPNGWEAVANSLRSVVDFDDYRDEH